VTIHERPPRPLAPLTSGDPLYTVAEVAEFLRVSPMTIYREIRRGAMSAMRVGNASRIAPPSWPAISTPPSPAMQTPPMTPTPTPPPDPDTWPTPEEVRQMSLRELRHRLGIPPVRGPLGVVDRAMDVVITAQIRRNLRWTSPGIGLVAMLGAIVHLLHDPFDWPSALLASLFALVAAMQAILLVHALRQDLGHRRRRGPR